MLQKTYCNKSRSTICDWILPSVPSECRNKRSLGSCWRRETLKKIQINGRLSLTWEAWQCQRSSTGHWSPRHPIAFPLLCGRHGFPFLCRPKEEGEVRVDQRMRGGFLKNKNVSHISSYSHFPEGSYCSHIFQSQIIRLAQYLSKR